MHSLPTLMSRRNMIGASLAAAGLASCGPSGAPTASQSAAETAAQSAAASAAAATASSAAPTNWTLAAFEEAMTASGRPTKLSQGQFDAIQARKGPALERIRKYL